MEDSYGRNLAETAGSLYSYKNAYVGDLYATSELINELDLESSFGKFDFDVQSYSGRNVLKLSFNEIVYDSKTFEKNLRKRAYLILALVEDAYEVQWTYKTYEDNAICYANGYLNVDDAYNNLNINIKEFGENSLNIERLLQLIL